MSTHFKILNIIDSYYLNYLPIIFQICILYLQTKWFEIKIPLFINSSSVRFLMYINEVDCLILYI